MSDKSKKKEVHIMDTIVLTLIVLVIIMITIMTFYFLYIHYFTRNTEDCAVVIVKDESFLSEFEVINNEVHIYCVVSLKNNSSSSQEVKLVGNFEKEVENGLLKEDSLEAYFIEDNTNSVVVAGYSEIKNIKIEFVGEYAGNASLSNRMLPYVEVIEIK